MGNHAGPTRREINAIHVVDGEVQLAISVVASYSHTLRHGGCSVVNLGLERTIPMPRRIETVSEPRLLTAISSLPSRLKSAAISAVAVVSTA